MCNWDLDFGLCRVSDIYDDTKYFWRDIRQKQWKKKFTSWDIFYKFLWVYCLIFTEQTINPFILFPMHHTAEKIIKICEIVLVNDKTTWIINEFKIKEVLNKFNRIHFGDVRDF